MSTWKLLGGRSIETPIGTFYLSYAVDPRTKMPAFPDYCELDTIAHQVAALPELIAALQCLKDTTDDPDSSIEAATVNELCTAALKLTERQS